MTSPQRRPRRNRRSHAIRESLAETHLRLENLVYPLFVTDSGLKPEGIPTLPGLFRIPETLLHREVEECLKLGLRHFALFPAIQDSLKSPTAREAVNPQGLIPRLIRSLKSQFPNAVLYSDIALDPYSSDGHDGLVVDGEIVNDPTVELLTEMALVHAQAGVDYVCPSDMMDGRIGAIRRRLDENDQLHTGILAYTAKYASCFYGPFRDALGSAPKLGDKKTYQMDFRNRRESILEATLDVAEGADIVMVKPALPYLDILRDIRESVSIPLAAYQVSGEYAMIKFAAMNGALDLDRAIVESLTSLRRAGADLIFTYFAKHFALTLRDPQK